MTKTPLPDAHHFRLRVPTDIKAYISERAQRNRSTQNAEFVRILRDHLDAERLRPRRRQTASAK